MSIERGPRPILTLLTLTLLLMKLKAHAHGLVVERITTSESVLLFFCLFFLLLMHLAREDNEVFFLGFEIQIYFKLRGSQRQFKT